MKINTRSAHFCIVILSILLGVVPMSGIAQSIFAPSQDSLIKSASSGVAVGVSDINGDGLDDILRWHDANTLQVLLQLPSGSFQLHYESQPTLNDIWNVTTYDLNRDGWGDIIASGNQTGIHYYMSDAKGNYTHQQDMRYQFRAQAANIVDMDFDAWPDVFVCNDNGENYMLKGDGNIPYDDQNLIPFEYPNPSDYAGNYGSVWEDVNGDGLPDLYVSKCYHDATEPSDPRRINQLFLTNPDSTYTEMAKHVGVADSAQSWSSTFADVDNDGDWDLLVLNHDDFIHLYFNEEGQFVKSTDFAGDPLHLGSSVQVIASDFNCDGFIDFLITGEQELLINNGDGSFESQYGRLGAYRNEISTASVGDLNHDGYPDLYIARHGLYNNPQGLPDQLLLNKGGDHHYFKLQLIDSNIHLSGLHTVCKVYTSQGVQMRSLRAGDAYGISNSNVLHFGLGQTEIIDSIHVNWLDGRVDRFYGVAANQNYYLRKGGPLQTYESNPLSKSALCMGDTANLNLPDTLENTFIYHYESATYDTSAQIAISDEGHYFWQGQTSAGRIVRGRPFYLPYDPVPDLSLNQKGNTRLCFGDSLWLNSSSEAFVSWNDGLEQAGRWVYESGLYYAQLEGACQSFVSDSIYIDIYPEISLQVQNDTIKEGNDALLVASGDPLLWYTTLEGSTPFYFGDSLRLTSPNEDNSFWVESYSIHEKTELDSLGERMHRGSNQYNSDFVDGALNFELLQDCELVSIEVETGIEGPRAIQLIQNSQLVRIDTFQVDSGKSTLLLNWPLLNGTNYTIKTDRGLNFEAFETYSPQLFRSIGSFVDYPYTDGQYIEITGSNYADREYFYFYNWKVKGTADTCFSERKEIKVVVKDQSVVRNVEKAPLAVYPNPASQSFRVQFDHSGSKNKLLMYDVDGRVVRTWENIVPGQELKVTELRKGVYSLVLVGEKVWGTLLFIKYTP